jgi:hypothetical protein
VHGRCLCAYLGALLLLLAAPANGATFRVLVRTGDQDGRNLAQRIQGQASDLEVDIAVVGASGLEPAVDAQLRAADRLAAAHHAQAVIWLDRGTQTTGGWHLYVLYPGRDRVLVRRLGQGTHASRADSAVLEEAALVVRATLQALVAGDEIGVERSVVEEEAAPRQHIRPSLAAYGQAALRPAPARARTDSAFSINAGWQIALDGISRWGQQGPTLGVNRGGGPWEVGLALAMSLGSELESGPATLRLARHVAAGRIGYRTVASQWAFAVGAQFGVALFTRSTTSTAPGFVPSADRIYGSLLGGPEVSLSFHPQWPDARWSVGFIAGADYVARAPEFGVGAPRQFQRLDALWVVQPRSSLYAGFEL